MHIYRARPPDASATAHARAFESELSSLLLHYGMLLGYHCVIASEFLREIHDTTCFSKHEQYAVDALTRTLYIVGETHHPEATSPPGGNLILRSV